MKQALKKSLYISLATLSLSGLVGTIPTSLNQNLTVQAAKKHKKAHGTKYKIKMTSAEKQLANHKYNVVIAAAKKNGKTGKIIIKSDKSIDPAMPFNKKNYEAEYIYALNHPSLIRGGQGAAGGQLTGITDGLNDYVQYQSSLAVKAYAQAHNLSQDWINANAQYNNKKTYAYWYVDGFHDNLGGDDSNGAKKNGGNDGLAGYKDGLKLAQTVKDAPVNNDMLQFIQNHLEVTVLAQKFNA